jgi:hypothetical protein
VSRITQKWPAKNGMRLREELPLKRYLINAAQMSMAVSLGLLLSPVLLSVRFSMHHLMHR